MIHERDLRQALAPIKQRLERLEALWDGLARQQEENAGRLVEAIDQGPVHIIGAFEDQVNDLERRLGELEAWRLSQVPAIKERLEREE